MQKLITALLLTCFLVSPALAYGTSKGSAKSGQVTGGACTTNHDCWQACTGEDGKQQVKCLNTSEGTSNCSDAQPGPVGLNCECLPDSKHCGYAFPKK